MIKKYLLLILGFSFFLPCSYILATETVMLKLSKKAKVFLSHDRWLHITEGSEEENYFSGGHDFGFFARHYLKKNNDKSVFFDTIHHAYIVSSKKGESLPEIISNLQNCKSASYHALFPPNILDKDFVLQAFKNAYDGFIAKDKQNNINLKQKIFYAQVGDFSVAGYFNKKGNDYFIQTIFPDLDWKFRIEFKHNPEKYFAISRFLQWNYLDKRWISQGLVLNEQIEFEKIKYLPQPIFYLFNPSNFSCGQLNGEEFSIMSAVKDSVINEFSNKNIDVLELFFDDSNFPKKEEFDLLLFIIKEIIPDFTFKACKELQIGKLRSDLNKYLKHSKNVKLIRNTDNNSLSIVTECFGGLNGLHFAEEILQYLLLCNFCEEELSQPTSKLFTKEVYTSIKQVSEKLAKNFMIKLVYDPNQQQKLKDKNIVFLIRTVNTTEYALELISKNNCNEYNQMGLFFVKGEKNFISKISFLPISVKTNKQSLDNLQKLNKIIPNSLNFIE